MNYKKVIENRNEIVLHSVVRLKNRLQYYSKTLSRNKLGYKSSINGYRRYTNIQTFTTMYIK